jgi:hypothetical protein
MPCSRSQVTPDQCPCGYADIKSTLLPLYTLSLYIHTVVAHQRSRRSRQPHSVAVAARELSRAPGNTCPGFLRSSGNGRKIERCVTVAERSAALMVTPTHDGATVKAVDSSRSRHHLVAAWRSQSEPADAHAEHLHVEHQSLLKQPAATSDLSISTSTSKMANWQHPSPGDVFCERRGPRCWASPRCVETCTSISVPRHRQRLTTLATDL